MGGHYLTDAAQPGVATLDMFEKMRHLLPEPPADIMKLMQWRTVESENMKRREVVGEGYRIRNESTVNLAGISTGAYDITIAHTDEAKQWEGWGTALKPAYEPIIIARKPLEGTVADNVLTHGVGAINVDGCRVPSDGGRHRKNEPSQDNRYTESGATNYAMKPGPRGGDPAGRWPANILHDGCFDDEPWGRYFYAAKASKADRNEGCEHLAHVAAGEVTGGRKKGSDGLNSPRAGAGRTSGAKNHHPTVKPTELMRWCCRLVTSPGGTVLDLFAGSGSTGKAALLEGFNPVLCEREAEYLPIIEARCAWALFKRVTEE